MCEVEAKFSKSLEVALSSVLLQLTEINAALTEAAQVAETALEIGAALQKETQSHQAEIAQRDNNLKFKGLEESQENNSDVIIFMDHWFAPELDVEPKIFLVITRLGVYRTEWPFPRDVVLSLADNYFEAHSKSGSRKERPLL